ncbi:MAG: hypothetical protein E5X53_17535 [Mesorhizobium sp.]|uniref:hypothetical protein n=1 Tax=Mesorhizobium sp. TaxID=1871066 RepID=UPI000FE9FFDB|nr:hypothetical protein [Mesorhizobium sp.]RWM16006.1 MAG: hypothetical protein EOR73_23280 [Mesorhizobium sp.]TIP73284.1 MAG: hypothetical protein E5X55_14255 [Mesorhizobium sp.]TIQ11382.1 MAG: hypothetical protein E5X57_18580 [Mesorhizobium sp.]TIR50962.1 MAG: hypothetical protein E5X53_17535 [Mesorhizobium sp.]TJV97318.1 MAG: hypothetical protein E5X52_14645 [Mesorhizobium sp.]
MARALALATVCLLAAGLSNTAAQGLFGAPPANSPADNAAPATPPAASQPTDSAPVQPGSPTAVVKPFYEHAGLELDRVQRSHFADPAKSVLDKSDALRKSGQGECLDPNMALDNAAYDRAEIDKSLKTIEAVKGDEAKVIVAFIVAGNPHRLEWKFKKVDGDWKISDLLSVTGEWALSQYQCE